MYIVWHLFLIRDFLTRAWHEITKAGEEVAGSLSGALCFRWSGVAGSVSCFESRFLITRRYESVSSMYSYVPSAAYGAPRIASKVSFLGISFECSRNQLLHSPSFAWCTMYINCSCASTTYHISNVYLG